MTTDYLKGANVDPPAKSLSYTYTYNGNGSLHIMVTPTGDTQ